MFRFSFLLMLSALTFVSCGDDDEGDQFMDDSMVGTWGFDSYDVDLDTEIQGLGSETFTATLISSDASITFQEDGTWTSSGDSEFRFMEGDSTYTETGSSIDSGTWVASGQTVTINSSDPDNSTFTVDEFTVVSYSSGSRVELSSNVDETIVDPIFGFTITTTGKVDIVLEQ